jgi:hypothetical protein
LKSLFLPNPREQVTAGAGDAVQKQFNEDTALAATERLNKTK